MSLLVLLFEESGSSAFSTAPVISSSSSTLSNSAVTVHHLALLYTELYSLSTSMLSTCLLSDVFQIEGCSAGLDVGFACGHRAMGGYQKGG